MLTAASWHLVCPLSPRRDLWTKQSALILVTSSGSKRLKWQTLLPFCAAASGKRQVSILLCTTFGLFTATPFRLHGTMNRGRTNGLCQTFGLLHSEGPQMLKCKCTYQIWRGRNDESSLTFVTLCYVIYYVLRFFFCNFTSLPQHGTSLTNGQWALQGHRGPPPWPVRLGFASNDL